MALLCVAASATYIVNDLFDVELDRQHLAKARPQPLELGALLVSAALIVLPKVVAVIATFSS
ncbi:hypothetical protein [Pseudomonas sp. PDM16]|uniref:hypothetical protein n=1 Tax=Pseudomonas sp. PDM16 TaxID=2769292 RepID=UPI001CE0B31A|nr:hypothetical protein [Pseudomonas sp. PDM16]